MRQEEETREAEGLAEPGMRATIDDVARIANVSTATVSRALARPELVSEETRRRVMEVVESTGYRPNALARALRTRAAQAVIVLVPDFGNPFYTEIVRGMERRASASDYAVLMGNTESDPERERSYMRLLLDRRADGLLLLSGRLPEGCPAEGPARPPIVFVSEDLPGSEVPLVRIDNPAAAEMAVRYLIDLGHRRIGHVAGPPGRILSPERHAGYRQALEAVQIPYDPALVVTADFTFKGGRAAARRLLDLPEPPTALFCANDESAMGALRAARDKGLRVPEDLSVIGFDDIQLAEITDPPLTTVRQPRAEMGAKAMDVLIRTIEGEALSGLDIVMPVELVVRGSTSSWRPRTG